MLSRKQTLKIGLNMLTSLANQPARQTVGAGVRPVNGTSSSVKPKQSAYLSDVVVTTSRWFRSEKMDSLLTLVIPVIIARSSHGFVLNVALNRLLVKEACSSKKG